jgi:hypothetical protein
MRITKTTFDIIGVDQEGNANARGPECQVLLWHLENCKSCLGALGWQAAEERYQHYGAGKRFWEPLDDWVEQGILCTRRRELQSIGTGLVMGARVCPTISIP